jgi:hypothetical protein
MINRFAPQSRAAASIDTLSVATTARIDSRRFATHAAQSRSVVNKTPKWCGAANTAASSTAVCSSGAAINVSRAAGTPCNARKTDCRAGHEWGLMAGPAPGWVMRWDALRGVTLFATFAGSFAACKYNLSDGAAAATTAPLVTLNSIRSCLNRSRADGVTTVPGRVLNTRVPDGIAANVATVTSRSPKSQTRFSPATKPATDPEPAPEPDPEPDPDPEPAPPPLVPLDEIFATPLAN